MIGGSDSSILGPLSEEEERLLFEVIQREWPEGIVKEGDPEDGTRHIFIYRTAEVQQQADAEGIVPEVEGHSVYLMLNERGAHFVVGVEKGSPGDALVHAISEALERPRVDF